MFLNIIASCAWIYKLKNCQNFFMIPWKRIKIYIYTLQLVFPSYPWNFKFSNTLKPFSPYVIELIWKNTVYNKKELKSANLIFIATVSTRLASKRDTLILFDTSQSDLLLQSVYHFKKVSFLLSFVFSWGGGLFSFFLSFFLIFLHSSPDCFFGLVFLSLLFYYNFFDQSVPQLWLLYEILKLMNVIITRVILVVSVIDWLIGLY